MILQLLPRMSQEELQDRLAGMDRSFKKLMARPNGARRLLEEIGAIKKEAPKSRRKAFRTAPEKVRKPIRKTKA